MSEDRRSKLKRDIEKVERLQSQFSTEITELTEYIETKKKLLEEIEDKQ